MCSRRTVDYSALNRTLGAVVSDDGVGGGSRLPCRRPSFNPAVDLGRQQDPVNRMLLRLLTVCVRSPHPSARLRNPDLDLAKVVKPSDALTRTNTTPDVFLHRLVLCLRNNRSPLGPPKGMTVTFVLEASFPRGYLGYHCALTMVSARRSSFLFSGLAKESLAAGLQADDLQMQTSIHNGCRS
ncbi:hypothetical protein CGCF413_v001853 [Colletotrichum fructicola]|nr:hypothetical protein CGCF413_v001853 [Colletotrichum fructicola]